AKGIKVVSNAGGLDPAGAAAALRAKADELGLSDVRIAYVDGDDLMPTLENLKTSGEQLQNLDTGESLAELGLGALTANAYLGARCITEALRAGADVVITGRVTDAALVIGPAAWWHGWSYDGALAGDQTQLDALAGSLVAGHVIECGTQATGGNYSFFQQIPGLEHPGFPLAEVAADGSSVITKHDGTGGAVTVGTVTAQLLYEIGGPAYLNPDVTARFDTIRLSEVGPDRVRISGVHGELPPARLKVAVNTVGGFRNAATLVMTGADFDAKADLVLRTVAGVTLAQVEELGHSPTQLAAASNLGVRELDVQLLRQARPDPTTLTDAQSHVRITVKDPDPNKVGRGFTSGIIEAALGSYPGMFATAPPGAGTPFGFYWPTTVSPEAVTVTVHVDGQEPFTVLPGGSPRPDGDASSEGLESVVANIGGAVAAAVAAGIDVGVAVAATVAAEVDAGIDAAGAAAASAVTAATGESGSQTLTDDDPTTSGSQIMLGHLVGARSGDKGGDANVGFWVPELGDDKDDARYEWFRTWLSADRVRELLPEADRLAVDVYPLPNLRSVNVVIHGRLGRGVAESTRLDPQAKRLGEQFRARVVSIPADLGHG
ncbi:MAG: acyclic terpene utilization AtuA family protein, partial [Actinomycetes bacterium]